MSGREFQFYQVDLHQLKSILTDCIAYNETIPVKIVSDFIKLIYDPYSSA